MYSIASSTVFKLNFVVDQVLCMFSKSSVSLTFDIFHLREDIQKSLDISFGPVVAA